MEFEKALAVLFFSSSSMVNTVVNKYLVTSLRIKSKFFILSVQTFVIVLMLLFLNYFIARKDLVLAREVAHVWGPVSFSLVLMIYSGLQANEHLPISLFTVLKNGSIPLVALHDWIFFGDALGALALASFLLIFLSSAIGTVSDEKRHSALGNQKFSGKSVTFIGVGWMAVNCLSSASYSIRMSTTVKNTNSPSTVASLYVNLVALPLLLLFSAAEAASLGVPSSNLRWIVISGGTSCLISVATACSARIFSTTTMTMIAALNKAPMALSGVIFGLEDVGSGWKWASVALAALSAFLYSVSRSNPVHPKSVV